MKDNRMEIVYGLYVVYAGMADDLFSDIPYEHEHRVYVKDFEHLSYLLSKEGKKEVAYKEGFDLEGKVKTSIEFKHLNEKGESLCIYIKDHERTGVKDKIRVNYQSTHVIEDEDVNSTVQSVFDSLFTELNRTAKRVGANVK